MSETVAVDIEALRARLEAIFIARGADAEAAAAVSDVLLEAELRGVVTHGTTRVASYVERIDRGQLDPRARPQVVSDGGAVVLLDASRGFGAVAGIHAARLAMERARVTGAAWVTTRRANHFGIAGYYSAMLAREGLLGLVCSNAGASMPATGGRAPVVGTNPISIAVPGDGSPVVLDMATSHVARGKIRRAQAEGRPIPEGWATDREGRPTTDPDAAMRGMLAPMAGHKGYALACMVDLVTGVLAGGPFSTGVRGATDTGGEAGVSFSVLAVDLTRVLDLDAYASRVAELRAIVASTARDGERTYLPGGPEDEHAARVRAEGLRIPLDVAHALDRLEAGAAAG